MIELWLIDVERSAPTLAARERDAPRLTAHDRRRAGAVKDPPARRQRLAIVTALRLLIERAAGAQVARQPFATGAAGKPQLSDGGIAFSLSHVEGYALIGLARGVDIGVDLERERILRLSLSRREAMMTAAEGLAGAPLADTTPDARFLQAWCRLEAFAKARGAGLGRTLADLGLRGGPIRTPAEVSAATRRSGRASGLIVRDVALPDLPRGPVLFAAVAIDTARRPPPAALLPTDRADLERLLRDTPASRRHPG